MASNRRGKKITSKLANLEAIQETQDLCQGCLAGLTEADYEAGHCTQCGARCKMVIDVTPDIDLLLALSQLQVGDRQ
jgi:hypothetical protein